LGPHPSMKCAENLEDSVLRGADSGWGETLLRSSHEDSRRILKKVERRKKTKVAVKKVSRS